MALSHNLRETPSADGLWKEFVASTMNDMEKFNHSLLGYVELMNAWGNARETVKNVVYLENEAEVREDWADKLDTLREDATGHEVSPLVNAEMLFRELKLDDLPRQTARERKLFEGMESDRDACMIVADLAPQIYRDLMVTTEKISIAMRNDDSSNEEYFNDAKARLNSIGEKLVKCYMEIFEFAVRKPKNPYRNIPQVVLQLTEARAALEQSIDYMDDMSKYSVRILKAFKFMMVAPDLQH